MFEVRVVFQIACKYWEYRFSGTKITDYDSYDHKSAKGLVQLIGPQLKIVLDNSPIFRLERSKVVDEVRPVNMLQRS